MISYGKRISAVGLLAALLLGTAGCGSPAEPASAGSPGSGGTTVSSTSASAVSSPCSTALIPLPAGTEKRPEPSSPMGTSADSAGGGTTLAQRPELEKGSPLHVTGADHPVGDVHPLYNEGDKTWYMFYLVNHNGGYEPRLMTSADMVTWTPRSIAFAGGAPLQTYYILGVVPSGGLFYSYFGNGYTMQSSKSSDLLHWEYSRGTNIPNSQITYPGGSRDPYVFYDADTDVYRCISTAYRTHDGMGIGQGMDVSLAVSSTASADLTTWQWDQRDLLRFPEGKKGEPECAQAVQIGGRWYLTAAMLHRTNTVGRLSYWTGDAAKGILEVDWQKKEERSLDGENLCAPQLAAANGRQYMWGWIPSKAFGGSWGGHLSLAREVYGLADGTLAVRLAEPVSRQIRGRLMEREAGVALTSSASCTLKNRYDRVDLEIDVSALEGELVISLGRQSVVIDREKGMVQCRQGDGDGKVYASAPLVRNLDGGCVVRVLAEEDILEVFVDDHTSLCARVTEKMDQASVKIGARGKAEVTLSAYRLKYREEI